MSHSVPGLGLRAKQDCLRLSFYKCDGTFQSAVMWPWRGAGVGAAGRSSQSQTFWPRRPFFRTIEGSIHEIRELVSCLSLLLRIEFRNRLLPFPSTSHNGLKHHPKLRRPPDLANLKSLLLRARNGGAHGVRGEGWYQVSCSGWGALIQ